MNGILTSIAGDETFAGLQAFVAQNAHAIILATLFSFLFLYVLGATRRIVIFFDGLDLAASVAMFLIPIISIIFVLAGAPDETRVGQAAYDAYFTNPQVKYILVGAGFAAVLCGAYTTANSFKYNGPLVGVLVSLFKILASLALIAVFALALFRDKSKRQNMAWQLLGVGLLVTLLVRPMVNGEAVIARRKLLEAQNAAAS